MKYIKVFAIGTTMNLLGYGAYLLIVNFPNIFFPVLIALIGYALAYFIIDEKT